MNVSTSFSADPERQGAEEAFAGRIARRLGQGATELPHDLSERLRAARHQALTRRKLPALAPAAGVWPTGGAAIMGRGWWFRLGAVLPLVALVVGLLVIHNVQDDQRLRDVAEIDVALLTDDLPPAAYTDPGFAQFLRTRAAGN
ncbi:MAG: DUF3619 family protein [Variovorax sp.]